LVAAAVEACLPLVAAAAVEACLPLVAAAAVVAAAVVVVVKNTDIVDIVQVLIDGYSIDGFPYPIYYIVKISNDFLTCFIYQYKKLIK
jgi:hypothetical protein